MYSYFFRFRCYFKCGGTQDFRGGDFWSSTEDISTCTCGTHLPQVDIDYDSYWSKTPPNFSWSISKLHMEIFDMMIFRIWDPNGDSKAVSNIDSEISKTYKNKLEFVLVA